MVMTAGGLIGAAGDLGYEKQMEAAMAAVTRGVLSLERLNDAVRLNLTAPGRPHSFPTAAPSLNVSNVSTRPQRSASCTHRAGPSHSARQDGGA